MLFMPMTPDERAWRQQARCAGVSDLFYAPVGERKPERAYREGQAKAICLDCPVLTSCRDHARMNGELGFWGGESEDERYEAGFPPSSDYRRRR